MSDDYNEFDDLVEQALEAAEGPERDALLQGLDSEHRRMLGRFLAADEFVKDSMSGAPPLHADPVAAMLGLIPNTDFRLDTRAFAQACSAAAMMPTQLAARLQARGWSTEVHDIARWHYGVASDVAPAMIRVLAEELGTSVEKLTIPTVGHTVLDEVAATAAESPRFQDLVQRFAQTQHLSVKMAEPLLRSRMLATVHRGDKPDVTQMLQSLDEMIRALEAE